MKFSISMPDELVKRIDVLAKESFCTRSGAITIAAREWVANQDAKKILPTLQAAIAEAAKGKTLSDEEQKQIDAFDSLVSFCNTGRA